ncbi:hypothetical protein B1R94_08250 [Mycolicibacterium litorale]|nr:hypothetical protein B1R94_08250 [Mycolicibacterium litorale]
MMTMVMQLGVRVARLTGVAALAWAVLGLAPAAAADSCPPGHVNNQYSGQCYLEGSAPTINGVPCVASNLGLCQSFRQNQQPPRKPYTSIGAAGWVSSG